MRKAPICVSCRAALPAAELPLPRETAGSCVPALNWRAAEPPLVLPALELRAEALSAAARWVARCSGPAASSCRGRRGRIPAWARPRRAAGWPHRAHQVSTAGGSAGTACCGTVGEAAGVTLCTATRKSSMSESTSSSEKLGWPRESLTSTLAPSPSSTLNRSRRNCEPSELRMLRATRHPSRADDDRHGDVERIAAVVLA